MVRTKRGERTVEEIMAAARAHLLEAGREGFSLREVARQVELAPSALYNHFRSKDDLINELALEAVQMLGAYFEPVPRSAPATEQLQALSQAYLRFASEQPERYRLVFDMLTPPTPQWEQYADVAYPFSLVVQTVQTGIDSGELRDAEGVGAAGLAYGLWSLIHGFVMLSSRHLAAIETDLTPLRAAAIRSYIGGLKPNTMSGGSR